MSTGLRRNRSATNQVTDFHSVAQKTRWEEKSVLEDTLLGHGIGLECELTKADCLFRIIQGSSVSHIVVGLM